MKNIIHDCESVCARFLLPHVGELIGHLSKAEALVDFSQHEKTYYWEYALNDIAELQEKLNALQSSIEKLNKENGYD